MEMPILKSVSPILSFQKHYFKLVGSSLSKIIRPVLLIFGIATQILQFFTISRPQTADIRIVISAKEPQATVEGRFKESGKRNRRNLAFLRSYAGISGIASRIFDVTAAGPEGNAVRVRRFMEGEYVADNEMASWRYQINLNSVGTDTSKAHISWMGDDFGILFLHDLLPQTLGGGDRSAALTLVVPDGWNAVTNERIAGKDSFSVADTQNGVFVMSKDNALRKVRAKSSNISISGKWRFTDREAAEAADAITAEYALIFGQAPPFAQITMMQLPATVSAGTWEADTRGANVTLLTADMPFISQSVQRLHEQLRHELFHLWIPEGVHLTGDYDWFFEGFALYESLKIGMRQNRIGFQDMLHAIGAAHKLDSSEAARALIAASADRWRSGSSTVYSRGMLIAFMADVAIIKRSGGKRSVEDLIREIYNDGKQRPGADGNDVVLEAMRRRPELIQLVDKYVAGADRIEWASTLDAAGIADNGPLGPKRLTVVPKPDRNQRALLDKLGYNNWRNLSESSK